MTFSSHSPLVLPWFKEKAREEKEKKNGLKKMSLAFGNLDSFGKTVQDSHSVRENQRELKAIHVHNISDGRTKSANFNESQLEIASSSKETYTKHAGPGNPFIQGKMERKIWTAERWYKFGFLYLFYVLVSLILVVLAASSLVTKRVKMGAYTFIGSIFFTFLVLVLLLVQVGIVRTNRYIENRTYVLIVYGFLAEIVFVLSTQVPIFVKTVTSGDYFSSRDDILATQSDEFVLLFYLSNGIIIVHMLHLAIASMYMITHCWFDVICQRFKNFGRRSIT